MGLENIHRSGYSPFSNNRTDDKRSNPRYRIDADIQYLMLNMDLPERGKLYDFSQSGALVSIRRKVTLGTRILFKVKSDEAGQSPIGVMATIVREAYDDKGAPMYGCQIDQITGLN